MRKFKTLLASLGCALALVGAAAPVADAHLGDWWTQYNITANQASDACIKTELSNPNYYCDGGAPYVSSGQYGDHSRYFLYEMRFVANGQRVGCWYLMYIGHDYGIFYRSSSCHAGWST